jgi:CcmD family protein
MDNLFYLFGAYTIAWLGVLIYVFRNMKKLKSAEEKIEDLESIIRQKE